MTLYLDDGDFQLYQGDVLEQLAHLPDESVNCVITSPPYWGLRDYGTGEWDGGNPDCDHAKQIARAPRCGDDCEFPCWQRIGIGPACSSCGCPPFEEEDAQTTESAES